MPFQHPPNLPIILRLKLTLHTAINTIIYGYKVLSFFTETKTRSSPTTPIHSVFSHDITVDPDRKLWFRLFLPSSPNPISPSTPVIVHFHGGGFRSFAPNSTIFDTLCRTLSSRIHAIVVSVNYRLSPKYRYPCPYDDGVDVLKFLDSPQFRSIFMNLSGIDMNLMRIFLSGDSAGGNIAHHVAVRAAEHKFNNIKLTGLIQLMPFFGGIERTKSELRLNNALVVNIPMSDKMWKMFLPKGADRDHGASNVMGPNGKDLSNVPEFPNTFVVCGGYDPLYDWIRKYCEWLEKCGKVVEMKMYENGFHGFYVFQELPDSTKMFQDVKEFVDRRMFETGEISK